MNEAPRLEDPSGLNLFDIWYEGKKPASQSLNS
jgi:hypothetical protein